MCRLSLKEPVPHTLVGLPGSYNPRRMTKDEGQYAFVLCLSSWVIAARQTYKGVGDGLSLSDNLHIQSLQYRLNGIDEGSGVRAGEKQSNHIVVHI